MPTTSALATRAAPERSEDVEAQAAMLRVLGVAAAAGPPEGVFTAVAEEASHLLGCPLVTLARYERSGREQVILGHTGDHVADGQWFPGANPNTISARMWKSRRPERVDDFAAVQGPRPNWDRRGVRACAAVPVFLDGELWGCLSANSRTGPLPLGTEDRLSHFAEIVAPAVESAAARVSARVAADEQAALLKVAALVAQGAPESAVFDAVTDEAARLTDNEPTTLVRYEGRRTFSILATHLGPAGPGTRVVVPADDAGTLDEIMRTHRPARRDRYDLIADRSYSHQQFGVGSSVSVPIVLHGRLWGALGVLNEGRWLPTETEGRLVKFCELVASALANTEARAELERVGLEQAALRRVAELAATEVSYGSVLRAVVAESAGLFDDGVVTIGSFTPVGAWQRLDREGEVDALGTEPARTAQEAGIAREVLLTGRACRIEDDEPARAELDRASSSSWACGVPISVEGQTWGVLIATAHQRSLPAVTEGRLTQFAHLAGAAVTAARSRDSLSRLARGQAALRRVAELIARTAPLEDVFHALVSEAATILEMPMAALIRFDPVEGATVVAGFPTSALVDLQLRSGAALRAEPSEMVGLRSLEGTAFARPGRESGVGAAVSVAVRVEGGLWGELVAMTPDETLPTGAEERLAEYAELAAAAVANAENRAELRASRARLVLTADQARRRLQRDVHDGAQQRLVQTVLTLKLGLDLTARGEDPAELMREALDNAELATVELRDLVHGILPASLSRGGLRSGLESLVGGLPIAVELDLTGMPERRLPADLETTSYFIIAEALTNAVKHADASRIAVQVGAAPAWTDLALRVVDDGRGGADPHGSGLTGLADRVDALNGELIIVSPNGRGTTIDVTLPLAPRRP